MGLRPQLGLVCITSNEEVRFRTITRARLLSFSKKEQRDRLRDIYTDNLARIDRAFDYLNEQGIRLYRMSSQLFPFADTPMGRELLDGMAKEIRAAGDKAQRYGIRVVAHPDQFVVLTSESPKVVANSVMLLEMHAYVMDAFGFPRSPWTTLVIHGGKGGRSDQMVEQIAKLPENIRSRIGLENDEYTYGAMEIADICRRARVPMVFDCHHHVVHEGVDSYDHPSVEQALRIAATTWPDPAWQLVHLSNGKESFDDPRHHDLITVVPQCYADAPWIEVEAKGKENAITQLRLEWAVIGGRGFGEQNFMPPAPSEEEVAAAKAAKKAAIDALRAEKRAKLEAEKMARRKSRERKAAAKKRQAERALAKRQAVKAGARAGRGTEARPAAAMRRKAAAATRPSARGAKAS